MDAIDLGDRDLSHMAPPEFVGKFIVCPTASARQQAWNLCSSRARELWKLRRHAFKLVYWPDSGEGSNADLDWDWISGFEKLRIGELRIDERINGIDNIRIIFFKSSVILPGDPLPRIWMLSVFAKKRQDFGSGQLAAFKGMRTIIVDREYGGSA